MPALSLFGVNSYMSIVNFGIGSKELAHTLIQRVIVYEDDKIEVVFQYQDEREQLLTAINEEGVA